MKIKANNSGIWKIENGKHYQLINGEWIEHKIIKYNTYWKIEPVRNRLKI